MKKDTATTITLATQWLGLTLLLLSVSTPPADPSKWVSSEESFVSQDTRTPYLYYAASVLSDVQSSGSPTASRLLARDEDEEENEDGSETQGKTDTHTASDIFSDDEVLSEHSSIPHSSGLPRFTQDADTLEHVMTYLSMKDTVTAQRVSTNWNRATKVVKSTPLSEPDQRFPPSFRPHTDKATFLYWTEDNKEDIRSAVRTPIDFQHIPAAERSRAFQRMVQWSCVECGGWTDCGRPYCRNTKCSAPCPFGFEEPSVQRLFVGQLRKEHTAAYLSWILSVIVPDVEVLHIESHTNKDGSREKGCAWLYLRNVADAERVLALSGRLFGDVDAEGSEGVWLCDSDEEEKCLLAQYAGVRSSSCGRDTSKLSRNCVVIERPSVAPKVTATPQKVTRPKRMPSNTPQLPDSPQPVGAHRARHEWDCPCVECMHSQYKTPQYTTPYMQNYSVSPQSSYSPSNSNSYGSASYPTYPTATPCWSYCTCGCGMYYDMNAYQQSV